MSTLEVWRPVPGYDGAYEVSSIGRVRSLDRFNSAGRFTRGRVLRAPINNEGYRQVSLCVANTQKGCRVHRLVCWAFNGPPGPEDVVRHLDGDALNNCADNLAWGTASENARDAVVHRTNNNAAKDFCKNQHPLSGTNLRIASNGYRVCRACVRANVARYKSRKAGHR